jgi:CheY-like chemotaxis protein
MVLVNKPQKYSILITDDDESSRESLRDIVAPEGFHTVLAGSGEEAMDIIQSRPVHLLLCDMHMPRLTGLETLHILRQQLKVMLPCILVSGAVDEQLMRQALSARAYSVIAKPVSKHVLLYVIVRALVKVYEAGPETAPGSGPALPAPDS